MSNKVVLLSRTLKQCDVQVIKNPAYVVQQVKEGGCVVEWNEEFERLTNFKPSEIDYKYCHELFFGVKFDRPNNVWVNVCEKDCEFRKSTPSEVHIIEDLWINCKDTKGEDIKKKVDIFVIPFEDDGRKNLHILINKAEAHSLPYFEQKYKEEHRSYMKRKQDKESKKEPGKVENAPSSEVV